MTAVVKSGASRRGSKAKAHDDLTVASRVLRLEADGIRALALGLGDSFVRAIDMLARRTGRIVVTGMGKSGHVGRKIAATLASTGSPALFVHPAEASHGDLGMIAVGDAVLALSNSGDTPELADIIGHTRRFRIPLVAITAGASSVLADAADVTLLLPRADEACPLGLAPTTSTTMTLALGDAIAIALLERHGFSMSDFKTLHPGGQLGRRLLKIADIMHTGDRVPLARPDSPMSDAILMMTQKSFGCIGIIDDRDRLIGIITDGDLRRHMSPDLLKQRAGDVMTASPKTIRPHQLAEEALAMMNMSEHPFTALFVVENGQPIGIVHVHDCLRAGVA